MKRIVRKYRFSKFRRFTNGLMFAIIAVVALILCLTDISDHSASMAEILLPFGIAVISMLMGFLTMFHEDVA